MRPRYPNIEAHIAQMDALPCRTLCAACEWVYEGSALEGRRAALDHRSEFHPDMKNSRRPQRNLRSFRQARLSDEHMAEILTARDRRAYQIGIEVE